MSFTRLQVEPQDYSWASLESQDTPNLEGRSKALSFSFFLHLVPLSEDMTKPCSRKGIHKSHLNLPPTQLLPMYSSLFMSKN